MFKEAQTFLVDKAFVKGAEEVSITRVDLFFRAKPKETGNRSGIVGPGVEVTLVPTLQGIPIVPEMDFAGTVTSRVEWADVVASPDASAATKFAFNVAPIVESGYEYAILIKYDGNEDFITWKSKQGDKLIGTNIISPGPSGKYVGNYYEYISAVISNTQPGQPLGLGYSQTAIVAATSNNSALPVTDITSPPSTTTADMTYLLTNWKPLNDTDLKFKVYVARYAHNGIPLLANTVYTGNGAANSFLGSELLPTVISNNVIQMVSPAEVKEYVVYDQKLSSIADLRWGAMAFQNTVSYPGGSATPLTVSVSFSAFKAIANGSYVLANGNTFGGSGGFNNIYTGTGIEYIIVKSGNNYSVRQVMGVVSNTIIALDQPCDFTNTTAQFFKGPAASIVNIQRAYTFGRAENMMILDGSNANTSHRFVNNVIQSITVGTGTEGGSGYNNSDYVVVSSFENVTGECEGGYSAIANVSTNSIGGITAVYMSNHGAGFVNTAWLTGANIVINNSSAQPSVGTGANLVCNVGMTLLVERCPNTYFQNCRVQNIQTNLLVPDIHINNPLGTGFNIKHRAMYYQIDSSNTTSGKAYYVNATPTDETVKNRLPHQFDPTGRPVLPSRSNEMVIRYGANGGVVNTSVIGRNWSNSAVYIFQVSSNSDYSAIGLKSGVLDAYYAKYIINNDYTNEHTNYGNAYAKHVATKVSFQADRFAEDLLVYLTAYRPLGTDLKVYARIHNSHDPEAFDDKDWTLLEEIDGIGVYSSKDDTTDLVEMTYGFPAYPNSQYTLAGTVSVANVTTLTVTGAGTNFTANLAANDLVKVWQPLFPNTYTVAVVDSIANTTSLTVRKPFANNGMVGAGLMIDKLEFKHQAFNNQLNDNVVRYYSEGMVEYDTYDTFQIKVVMISNNDYIVPKFDDLRGIGVTA